MPAVPTTVNYNWEIPPNHPVPCFAQQCDHYYLPPVDSAPTADVILRLLLPDSRILIVECDAKQVAGPNFAIQFFKNSSDAEVPMHHPCRAPQPNAQIAVIFDGSNARLLFPGTRGDDNDKPTVETYHIKGSLTPIPGSELAAAQANYTRAFITTLPWGAQVFLDGERAGTSPVQLNLSPTEVHVLTIKKEGYLSIQKNLPPHTEQTRFDFRLQPATP